MTTPDCSTTRRLISEKPSCFDTPVDGMQVLLKTPDSEQKIAEGGLRLQGLYKTNSEDKPLITVVTIVYNGAEFLEETIKSVIEQTYDNVEYIIVDGGSTDGTLEIINKYDHVIDYWVSEPDKGISSAFNKGINLSNACSYILFINAGDLLFSFDTLLTVSAFLNKYVDVFSGKVSVENKYVLPRSGINDNSRRYIRIMVPHQGLFVKKNVFFNYGLFNENIKIRMDLDFISRLDDKVGIVYEDIIVSYYNLDGVSSKSFNKFWSEGWEVLKENKQSMMVKVEYLVRYAYRYIRSF